MTRSADKLIAELTADIASGRLRPGDQLLEAELASRFGLSRTPIREAIRALVDQGLLVTRPRKGAFVRVLTAHELLDLFEVAAELEGMACRLAAQRLTQGGQDRILHALDAADRAAGGEDVAAYATANLAFHAGIHAASGNQWLVEQLASIGMRINPYRSMPYEVRGRLAASTQEHRDIYNAIVAGDGIDAAAQMRDHMMMQGQRLPVLIKALARHPTDAVSGG